MPPRRTTPTGYQRAHELRQHTTPAETKLWAYLRRSQLNGVRFRRQHAIGEYIVDFCSPSERLIVELDGSGHLDNSEYDSERTEFLSREGYRVLRFLEQGCDKRYRGGYEGYRSGSEARIRTARMPLPGLPHFQSTLFASRPILASANTGRLSTNDHKKMGAPKGRCFAKVPAGQRGRRCPRSVSNRNLSLLYTAMVVSAPFTLRVVLYSHGKDRLRWLLT